MFCWWPELGAEGAKKNGQKTVAGGQEIGLGPRKFFLLARKWACLARAGCWEPEIHIRWPGTGFWWPELGAGGQNCFLLVRKKARPFGQGRI